MLLSLITGVLALVPGNALAGLVQKPGLALPTRAFTDREVVRQMHKRSYDAYRKYAFGHDDLRPLSKTFADTRNGWGASIIDALTTNIIMNFTDYVDEAIKFASNIDFSRSKTDSSVSVFETTIRYVGGLLSAYELSGNQYPVLVKKAQEVADKLLYAFSDQHPIPHGYVDFSTNEPDLSRLITNIAEVGTLTLEWSVLSKYTANPIYRTLSEQAVIHIANNAKPLPGLPAQLINPASGEPINGYVTWGGGSDSYLEYLIKYPRLSQTDNSVFVNNWVTAVDSSITHLAKRTTIGNHLYLGDINDSGEFLHVGSHLACFYGGNWILGGRLLDNDTIVQYGLQLTDGCWNTYESTATGIGPEAFAFKSEDGDYIGYDYAGNRMEPDSSQESFYDKNGYYITQSSYLLRPEVLESNFYAWRATGDSKYYERALAAVGSMKKHLATDEAYAGIQDVNNATSAKNDHMESFWFAEVLKYLYLTFDDPNHISLDEYVFNTEAHPLKAPLAKGKVASPTILPPGPQFVAQGVDEDTPLPEISPISFEVEEWV
ncbi:glycoside hydrolase family 47 protein [Pluteus cervinus]|uniref:Glycoside hydrolase family 47 protein n=1 Tax=Pluteus cervinus TaxID=181527 RepID=A0ACD3B799_9AGAR|nr:glycoside hydrolase family 47 protein [Pluteus cervinus]